MTRVRTGYLPIACRALLTCALAVSASCMDFDKFSFDGGAAGSGGSPASVAGDGGDNAGASSAGTSAGSGSGATGAGGTAGSASGSGGASGAGSGATDASMPGPDAASAGTDAGPATCEGGCGACRACVDGTCQPVNAGEADPSGTCGSAGGSDACGEDGKCDGAGACSYRLPVAALCNTTCAGGERSTWTCNDQHVCAVGAQEPCPASGGGACDTAGSDCVTRCSDDGGCSATHFCCRSGDAALCDVANAAGSCVVKLNRGSSCLDDRQCSTGHCTDGVCCTSDECAGDCQACNIPGVSLGQCARYDDSDVPTSNDAPAGVCAAACRGCGGASNDCVYVDAGDDWSDDCAAQPLASCGRSGACDGAGACALHGTATGCDDGNACTYGDRCDGTGACGGTSITCTDDPGTCGANRVCNGTATCAVSYPGNTVSCDDGQYCNGADSCDGAGACARHAGSPCSGSCIVCDEAANACRNMTTWFDAGNNQTWEIAISSANKLTWQGAIDYCNGLSLCGKTDWRLPTISEARKLIRGCDATGTFISNCCLITDGFRSKTGRNALCDGCVNNAGPDAGCYRASEIEGECSFHWTATAASDDATVGWVVDYRRGFVDWIFKDAVYTARCVRTGN